MAEDSNTPKVARSALSEPAEDESAVSDAAALCLWCTRDLADVEFCQRCGFSPPSDE